MTATNEELIELIRSGQDRQENLLRLYTQNQGIIYKLCQRYSKHIEMADLLQEAFIVLVEAVDKYDPVRADCSFINLFQYILTTHYHRILRPGVTAIRLPFNFSNMVYRYKKMTRIYRQTLNKIPDDKTYCHELKINITTLATIRKHLNDEEALSINSGFIAEDGSFISYIDNIAEEIDPTDEILDAEQHKELQDALEVILSRLPTDSADVLREYFIHNVSLPKYAEMRGISRQAASLRKTKALDRIRREPESIRQLRYFVTPDDFEHLAYRKKGVRSFLADQTSTTEDAAIKLIDIEKQKALQAEKKTAYFDHIATKYMTGEHLAVEV